MNIYGRKNSSHCNIDELFKSAAILKYNICISTRKNAYLTLIL